jgi:O-antigen/teichoic acid export membrane protein
MNAEPTPQPQWTRQLWYLPVLAAAMGLMLARTVLLALVVDVEQFGAFSAGLLVSATFSMLACLGLQQMLLRDMSIHVVRQRERLGMLLLAQCVLVASACAVAAAPLGVLGHAVAGLSGTAFAVAILHGLAQQLFLLATVESRSRGNPLRFAKDNLARAVAVSAAGLGAAAWTQSATVALLVEAAISLALAGALLKGSFARSRLRVGAAFRLGLRRLPRIAWGSALALLAVTVLSFAVGNADRWLAAQQLPPVTFAHYAFAWTLLVVAQSLQVMVNAAIFPALARRFARNGARSALAMAARCSCFAMVLGALGSLLAWLSIDMAFERWFAAYAAAREVVPLLLFMAVLRMSDFWSSYMMVVGSEGRLFWVTALAGVFGLIGWAGWAAPWGRALTMLDAAALGAALAASSYAATATAAALDVRRIPATA